ncbi:MAG: ribosome small subunit-dependent GTPase A [Deltaproteobacteria bacterium]
MNKKIIPEDLGYEAFFGSGLKDRDPEKYSIVRVISEHKELYRVQGVNGEFCAKIPGKMMFAASKREDYPAVGDWVTITGAGEGTALIHRILPRRTILKKKYSDKQETQVIAANVDTAFIVGSVDQDYNLNRFERYLVLVSEGKIEPVLVLNKTDLITDEELSSKIQQLKARFNGPAIIPTSIVTEDGLSGLMGHIMKGKTYCFLGSSGVGKSSLINKLIGEDMVKTKEISLRTGKGRHTTTSRELYILQNGGIVIDNPGTREVGIADADNGINEVFDDIEGLAKNCKYSDCTHTHEPGCAVLQAVKEKKLDGQKFTNFGKLKKETAYYEMTELEKRKKDRTFGKFVKKTLAQLKRDDF